MTGTLYAREAGRGGKTIVLLHGFGGHHRVWYDIQPVLARDARTLAYDLPGHGASLDYPGAGAATSAAKAVIADLAARGIGKAHLVGYSMGGAIATLIALRAPDAVASLTLLAPGGFGPEINASLLRRYASATGADDLRPIMSEMAAPGFVMPTKYVASLTAVRRLPGQREKLEEIVALITRDDRQGEIPRDVLAGLAMPVSLVWGTADPVLPFSQTRDLPPSFRLRALDGVGHQLLVEAEKTVVQEIRKSTSR
jgi:pyruvate dehydrogenase E2 component (dihydrolipoamide acetyltransferase)